MVVAIATQHLACDKGCAEGMRLPQHVVIGECEVTVH